MHTAEKNSEYASALINTVLSKNNIKNSNTGGYVGDLSCTTNSPTQLKPGEEKISEDDHNGKKRMTYYRYQISPNCALEFTCDKIEAVMAYNEQQAQEKAKKSDGAR